MKLADIIQQVRVVLDHNEVTESVEGFLEVDTLKLDDIITSQVEPAARHILLIAPEEYIDWHDRSEDTLPSTTVSNTGATVSDDEFQTTGEQITGGTTLTLKKTKSKLSTSTETYVQQKTYCTFYNNCIYVELPSGFLRLGSAKLNCWDYPLDNVVDVNSKEYRRCAGEFTGLKPTSTRPMMALVKHGNDLFVELHGCSVTNQAVDWCNIVTEPAIEDVAVGTSSTATEQAIDISANLEKALTYCVASYVAEVLRDTSKSNTLMEFVYTQLGIRPQSSAQQVQQPQQPTEEQ